jgi:hypothetical protein
MLKHKAAYLLVALMFAATAVYAQVKPQLGGTGARNSICIATDSGRLYSDDNCGGSKDGSEEYLDHAGGGSSEWTDNGTYLEPAEGSATEGVRVGSDTDPPCTCGSSCPNGILWASETNGLLYMCDATRNKWLAPSITHFHGEESSQCAAGATLSSQNCNVDWGNGGGGHNQAIWLPYDATIVGFGFSHDEGSCGSGSYDVEVWGTGSGSNDNIGSSTLGNGATLGTGTLETLNSNSLDLDIAGDQYISWGLDNNCSNDIDDFVISLYLRWRA